MKYESYVEHYLNQMILRLVINVNRLRATLLRGAIGKYQ